MTLVVASPRDASRIRLASNLSLLFVALCFVAPMIWVLLAAFNPHAALSIELPETWSLVNFSDIFAGDAVKRPFLNSLIISLGAAALVVVLATLAAYPLSRFKLRYGNTYIYTIIFASALPVTAIMVPVYVMFVKIGLVNTVLGVILFRTAAELPFAIWLSKGFLDAVPIELEEAAWIDGASRWQAAMTVVLPLIGPGLATIFILNFIENWGNFFVPFILLQGKENYPLSVSLYSFFGEYGEAAYGQLAAFALIYTVPSLLVYLLVQRPLQQGLRFGGAVKS